MTDGVPTPRELLLSGVSKCNGSTIVKVMIQRMFCRLWVCLLLLGPAVSVAEDPAAGLRERDGTAADWPQYLNSGNWLLVEVWDPDCPICNASVAEVIELDRQGQLLGLRVLGIALHEAGNTDAIDRYIEQHGIGFRNLLDSGANFAHIYQQLTGTSWGG